ncbi:transketolase [Salinibacterium sp. NG22]|uniref:transketolase n=1 Tax=Salinibacterium sp. NG22 TaxID=2792040 RepID=UPI0018CF4670|nr:transketolase [Salinibacterium sp. NG22]MBH0109601.1 transketolase [Salinibacterium sp. NG22]
MSSVDNDAITTARLLALDAVESAGSGHPGTAIALAPVAHLLFQKHIRHNPSDPQWAGRDRFVLSCGHASILLYTQLFLTGYGLTVDDLRSFRALGSLTPGHPEYGHTAGVETTTGPLGQGLATAVGMAMAMKHERAMYDADAPQGSSPFDRTVWVVASDGDLQEGLSYEAGAIAGRHELDNLVVIYDDNEIQIEGDTALTTSEDVAERFRAQKWTVDEVGLATNGDVDIEQLDSVLSQRRATSTGPHLVILKSQIAWPAPNAVNTAASHGAPLGTTEATELRKILGVSTDPFEVSDEVLAHTRSALARGAEAQGIWSSVFDAWSVEHPELAAELTRIRSGALPDDLESLLPTYEPGQALATRDASGHTIQRFAERLPELWGGSADLAEPNRTSIVGGKSFLPEETETSGRAGRNVHWGVREHAMAAAMNGITLVTGSRFFAGTFLVFSDYQRPSIRLASLMQLPVTYLWSHDSVALGSDGPTHQPIEHLASLRAIPGFAVVRPADATETAAAWLAILERNAPAGLVLARQPLPVAATPAADVRNGVRRGAYAVLDAEAPDVILIATGSEVSLALEAAAALASDNLAVRVVSMPSREWFAEQPDSYRNELLPSTVTARVTVEAASTFGWSDLAGPFGQMVGIDEFGLSAPAADALQARGMTVQRVLDAVATTLAATRQNS